MEVLIHPNEMPLHMAVTKMTDNNKHCQRWREIGRLYSAGGNVRQFFEK
jgi:hypothetical protein